MIKGVRLLVIGALAGAAGFFLAFGFSASSLTGSATAEDGGGFTGFFSAATRRGPDVPGVTDRLAAYRDAQNLDAPALADALRSAAARPGGFSRDLEIDSLLGRLASLDAPRAAALALELQLPSRFVADVWAAWSTRDADAAIASLTQLPGYQRAAVARAVFESIGSSLGDLGRFAAVVSASDFDELQLDWIAWQAQFDPAAAFSEARYLPDAGLRRQALERVAAVWARGNPVAALSQAAALDDAEADAFRRSVTAEWASVDATGVLNYLHTRDWNPAELEGAMPWLLASDPEAVLDLVDGLSLRSAGRWRREARIALAGVAPERALSRLVDMPAGIERDAFSIEVVRAALEADAGLTMAWAESLDPPFDPATQQIIAHLASTDYDAALEYYNANALASGTGNIAMLVIPPASDPDKALSLAGQLLRREDAQSKEVLGELIEFWARSDPDTAFDWMFAQGEAIDSAVVGRMAAAMAASDPARAAASLDRVAPSLREVWVTRTAGEYGQYDPDAAIEWLSTMRGQPGYELGMREMINSLASSEPARAAALATTAPADTQLGTARTIVTRWASQDPAAAARWVGGLSDPRARRDAAGLAAGSWAAQDLAAAERWTLSLEDAEMRDSALTVLIRHAGNQRGNISDRLLDGFSTETALQDALSVGISSVALRDPARARQLLNDHISDPSRRAEIELMIERAQLQR